MRVVQQELALEWDPAIKAGRHAAGGAGQLPDPGLLEAWAARTRALAAAVDQRVSALGPLQALLVRCLQTTSRSGEETGDSEAREELFVRVETAHGGLLESWGAPLPRAPTPEEVASIVGARLEEAESALRGPAVALDPSLPLCLSPSAAAPLIAALGTLLRGDIAGSSGLARNAGKRVLAPAVTVIDHPAHPLGSRQRRFDDEGVPCAELTLVDGGRLAGFLHTQKSAAALGVAPNGRGFGFEGPEAVPGPLNLALQAGPAELPADHAWLCCRIETFTPSPALGVVTLRLAGREQRSGRPGPVIAPFEAELSVMETLRRVRGTGPRLDFFPAFDGVGTPWLLLEPGAFQGRIRR
ncbi:MAG: metallopeptidase TldD-related protein [Myxococcota bacterium]|nr:metallopeptidase TldD-related protein [Myxococcota bacterium]